MLTELIIGYSIVSYCSGIPRAESGPLWPGGPELDLQIPVYFTLNSMCGALQEGALHTMLPSGAMDLILVHFKCLQISKCGCGHMPL